MSLLSLSLCLLITTLGAAAPALGASLYVTSTRSDSASIIDTDSFEVVGTIPLGQGKPNRIVFHPDGKTAWVVYDKSPHEATLTLDGKFLYATLWKANKIAVVRTSDDKVVTVIQQKGHPDLVTMEPTGAMGWSPIATRTWSA